MEQMEEVIIKVTDWIVTISERLDKYVHPWDYPPPYSPWNLFE